AAQIGHGVETGQATPTGEGVVSAGAEAVRVSEERGPDRVHLGRRVGAEEQGRYPAGIGGGHRRARAAKILVADAKRRSAELWSGGGRGRREDVRDGLDDAGRRLVAAAGRHEVEEVAGVLEPGGLVLRVRRPHHDRPGVDHVLWTVESQVVM